MGRLALGSQLWLGLEPECRVRCGHLLGVDTLGKAR